MKGFKAQHWIAIALTLGVVVLLMFAPHHSGQFENQEAETAEEAEVPNVEFLIDSALIMVQAEAPMQGILLLRQIADDHPGNFRAQYHLGKFSAQTGQWEKVIERFENVKSIDPEFVESEYWTGLAQFQLGDTAGAISALENFVTREKENNELVSDAQTMLNQLK